MGWPSVYVMPGDKYGRLEVICELPPRIRAGKPKRLVECRCQCGTTNAVLLNSLRRGATVSCGCHKRETAKRLKRTHGRCRDHAYSCWYGMLRRCTATTDPNYPHYGGRGISVCERWKSIEAFLEDMGPRPSLKHSIERIDNDGNYEPGNCRWASRSEQHRNTRHNRRISHAGKTLCVTDWAELTGLTTSQIRFRLDSGWPVDLALTLPRYSRLAKGA